MNHPAFRIRLMHVSVTMGGQRAISDLSASLASGETLLVLGANGSGKSTLLRLLRGDIWPDDDGRGQRLYQTGTPPDKPRPSDCANAWASFPLKASEPQNGCAPICPPPRSSSPGNATPCTSRDAPPPKN